MEKSTDIFAWTQQLECPATICNDTVKKTLCSGLVGLLWDDLSEAIFNAQMAETIRKNVLLHHLRKGSTNKVIESTKNMAQLKLNRIDLKNQITKLEEEYEQQDYMLRQKVQKLRYTSSKRQEMKARKDLLKMKFEQTSTQLRDCNDMRQVCQHLMPSTCKELEPKVLVEMSDVVTSLWTGANKRQVWDTVSSKLDHIEVPTLWLHLYKSLTVDVDTLMKSEAMKSVEIDDKSINVGMAKIYGQHISMVSKRILHTAKRHKHEQNVLEFIKQIEVASNNSADVSEWLALALEVCKLEAEQKSLQEQVDKIRDDVNENNAVIFTLAELTTEIRDIDATIAEYIQDIQQSLNLLKSAPTFLMKAKENINVELQKIIAMRGDGYDLTILENNLTNELDIFHDIIDLNALRKIMLKGHIGIYRYTKSCYSDAVVPLTNSKVSHIKQYFPLIQTPIYSLIECYNNLVSMFMYKKLGTLEIEENPNMFQLPVSISEDNDYNILELLKLSEVFNTKTRAEIDEYYEILNAWETQAVQKAMEIIDKTVEGCTFSEWVERYDLLLYMVQKST